MKKEKLKLEPKTFNEILALRKKLEKKLPKDRYDHDEDLLKEYLTPLLKKHDLPSAYFKATLINSFYSTQMGAERLFKVAEQTEGYKINNILSAENIGENQLNTLDSFTKITVEQKKKRTRDYGPYSFLTKYIAIHDRLLHGNSRFPIYDKLVARCIVNLVDKKEIEKETNIKITHPNLRKYQYLYKIMSEIAKKMGYKNNLTAVDQVFWAIGKYLWGTGKKRTIEQFNKEARENILTQNMEATL